MAAGPENAALIRAGFVENYPDISGDCLFADVLSHARTLSGKEALDENSSRVVDEWLRYDERCTRLCGEIRDWQARADALLGERTGPGKNLEPMRRWRARAEPMLAEGREMLAKGSPHARHLAAMPEERKARLAAAGAGRDAIDGNAARIAKRLREDEEAAER